MRGQGGCQVRFLFWTKGRARHPGHYRDHLWICVLLRCIAQMVLATDVTTYHNDNSRTGQNLHETTLTTSNVNFSTFGKLGTLPVDGIIDAEPVYLSGVSLPGKGTHNVLYA